LAGADKLLDRMRANPRDWRIDDVARLCAGFGIACAAPRKGSHYKVSHEAMPMILTIPAHRPIKPVYIRDLVAFIDSVRERGY
jgi:hypothetical protein